MKKTLLLVAFSMLAMATIVSSCKKKGEEPKPEEKNEVKTEKFLDVRDYAKWVYYSFKENKIVKVADHQEDLSNDMSWDIAFHRWDVRTNGGKSGKGKGGAFKSNVTDLEAARTIVPSSFVEDVMGEIVVSFKNLGGGEHEVKKAAAPINTVLTTTSEQNIGWIDTSHGSMGPKYEISPNVYFIRTVDGRVVAMKFKNHKSAELKTGFVTFDYTYVKQ